jgi:4-hydroxy-3-polyprenylbenzoate decarboxylase
VSVFDLRQWIAAAEQAGELERVPGASADLEIGAASQLNYRRARPRALLFEDIPGYRPGRRVLTSSLAGPSLMGMSLGFGTGLGDAELVQALRGRPSAWRAGSRRERRPRGRHRAGPAEPAGQAGRQLSRLPRAHLARA